MSHFMWAVGDIWVVLSLFSGQGAVQHGITNATNLAISWLWWPSRDMDLSQGPGCWEPLFRGWFDFTRLGDEVNAQILLYQQTGKAALRFGFLNGGISCGWQDCRCDDIPSGYSGEFADFTGIE